MQINSGAHHQQPAWEQQAESGADLSGDYLAYVLLPSSAKLPLPEGRLKDLVDLGQNSKAFRRANV